MPAIFVRFEYGQEDRIGEPMGPYEYIRQTYDGLWTPDREQMLASIEPDDLLCRWRTADGQIWSDFVVYVGEPQ